MPTLIMMQCIANNTGQPYTHVSVNATGKVNNTYSTKAECQFLPTPMPVSLHVPADQPFSFSLHEDLGLLVAAEARGWMQYEELCMHIRRLPHQAIGFSDRGAIITGLRVDSVFLSADLSLDQEGLD